MKALPEDRSDSLLSSSSSSELAKYRRYNRSPKGRARWIRYNQSVKGKTRNARYRATPELKLSKNIWDQQAHVKLRKRLHMQSLREADRTYGHLRDSL